MVLVLMEIAAGAVLLLLLVYRYFTRNYEFWSSRKVVGPKPKFPFGNFKDTILGRVHTADHVKALYDEYANEPAVGLYYLGTPALMVKDLEMLKEVLIKSFPIFADRAIKIHPEIDPLSQHLVFLESKRWKPLRKTLTPVFTSGKLREMYYLINECAEHFKDYIDSLVTKGEPIEVCELTAKFTTDVIGVCAFGLNMNSLSDKDGDGEFRRVGRSLFEDTLQNRARRAIRMLPYWIARFLKPIARNEQVIKFFVNTLKETMEYRKKNNIRRNDFVDMLMDIKDNPEKVGQEEMSEYLLTAQAFVFFVAGFETSSTTMSHAMYELALNPDIQDKLREEIKESLEKNNGILTYDSIKEMKYLNKVFKETLRKYPPAFQLSRRALNDYTFADSKISIPKGCQILIPVYAIHHDSNIYPKPEKFDPERFDEETASARPPMSFLAFGDGPRNCIGERFAQNQTKVGLAVAIQHFKFEICNKTCIPYVKRTKVALLAPVNGLYLKIKKI